MNARGRTDDLRRALPPSAQNQYTKIICLFTFKTVLVVTKCTLLECPKKELDSSGSWTHAALLTLSVSKTVTPPCTYCSSICPKGSDPTEWLEGTHKTEGMGSSCIREAQSGSWRKRGPGWLPRPIWRDSDDTPSCRRVSVSFCPHRRALRQPHSASAGRTRTADIYEKCFVVWRQHCFSL